MTEKRYLVTGATSGLGLAVLHALAERGDAVQVIGRDIARLTSRFFGLEVDMTDPAAVTAAVKDTSTPWDGIVHCAGAEVVAPLRLTSDEQYRTAMMAADSAFAILRAAAAKGVMADGGSIVLMSSVAAHRGTAGMAAYSAGKAAIEGMCRAAAVELVARRIRVNCVAAGAFRSPMHDRITRRMPEAAQDAYAAQHPLGIGAVDAVRDAVLYLLGETSRWSTGSVMTVDGGFLAG